MKRLALAVTTLALLAAPAMANGSETFRRKAMNPHGRSGCPMGR